MIEVYDEVVLFAALKSTSRVPTGTEAPPAQETGRRRPAR